MEEAVDETDYNYIHKPKHYSLFTVDDLRALVEKGEGIDVVAIANKARLDCDAYMFNVLKYVLRQKKPNEPRRRDVEKIREYADIWLENDARKNGGALNKSQLREESSILYEVQ